MISCLKRWNLLIRKNHSLLFYCVLVVLILLVSACDGVVRGPKAIRSYQQLTLNTSDGFVLSADYYPSNSDKGLVMLHMMGKTRASYRDIAPLLMDDYHVFTFDFRGHGQSDGDFSQMTDREFAGLLTDLQAAVDFLNELGVESISLVGGSIGANVALIYASENEVDKLVLLAPGSSYRSLDISRVVFSKEMLVQVGHYDAYSSISVGELETNWERARIMKYDVGAHGTDLLQYDLSAKEDFLFYLT
jgi:pimeloyl-ACP methyl ester carboxylesterase